MGEVAVTLRLMPESPDIDLNAVRERISDVLPSNAKLHGTEIRPIAFGLKALIAVIILGDTAGGTDLIEQKLSEIEGIQSVEVLEAGLL